MTVTPLQYLGTMDPFYLSDTFRQYAKAATDYLSSTTSPRSSVIADLEDKVNVNLGFLYPSFLDPGAVWERTDEPVTYEINGESRQSNIKLVENAVNWNIFKATRYNSSTQIGVDIDYTVSVYQSYKEYIQENFTGEERDTNLAKLHELTAQAMKNIADGYSSEMGGFFEQYGVTGERDLLKDSILAWFSESLSEKSGVLLADFGISAPENNTGNLYSRDDIFALEFMYQATVRSGGISSHFGNFSREDYPASFVGYAIKMESIYNAFSVSDSLKDKFETVFFNRVNDHIDLVNEINAKKIETMSAYGPVPKDLLAQYAPFDKEAILQVVKNVLESLRSGISATDAVAKTDYFDIYFKGSNPLNMPSSTLADEFNWFLTQMGFISQRSENINWTKSKEWVA